MNVDTKINRVIAGSKTREQLICSSKFLELAYKRTLISSVRLAYWIGAINGIAHALNIDYSEPTS